MLPLPHWQELREALTGLTGLSIALYDPVTKNLSCEEDSACAFVHGSEPGRSKCTANIDRQVALALQGSKPLFFQCETAQHLFAVPFKLPDGRRFALVGGKLYFSEEEFERFRQQAAASDPAKGADPALRQPPARLGDHETLARAAALVQRFGCSLLENAYLREHYEQSVARLTSLLTLCRDLKEDGTEKELLQAVLRGISILFEARASAILRCAPSGEWRSEDSFGEVQEIRMVETSALIGGVVAQKVDVSCDDVYELLKSGLPDSVRKIHLFPIFWQEQVAILALINSELAPGESSEICAFLQPAAVALQNARLKEEVGRRSRVVRLMMELTRLVGNWPDPEPLLEKILEKATEYVEAEQGSLMLVDEERDALVVRAAKGVNKALIEPRQIRLGEAVAGRVWESGQPLLVRDIEKDLSQPSRPRYKTRSFISIPLKLHDRTIGILNVSDKISGKIFCESDLDLLTAIGSYASVAIERSAYQQKAEALKMISITDPLTGLLNRRYFQERLTEEIERSRRHKAPVSLVIMDIDDFKTFNDTYGHPGGDEILKIFTRNLRNSIRTIDVAARWGGEEFTIILPQTGKEEAAILAERVRREVEREEEFGVKFGARPFTVSMGVAAYPEDASTLDDLIASADRALYAAKGSGKNRVRTFGE